MIPPFLFVFLFETAVGQYLAERSVALLRDEPPESAYQLIAKRHHNPVILNGLDFRLAEVVVQARTVIGWVNPERIDRVHRGESRGHSKRFPFSVA
jgi:hypothetical protein